MKPRTYLSLLSIYGLPTYDKRTRKRLVKWLLTLADAFETDEPKEYHSIFRARLMK